MLDLASYPVIQTIQYNPLRLARFGRLIRDYSARKGSSLIAWALLLCATCFAQLPDAPTPQPKQATFLTFRKSWQDPPLRTNKQVFKSPVFLLSQSAMILSMVVACRNKRSGETWGSEVPAVAGVFGLDYLSDRLFAEYFSVGPAIYAVQHYARAATR